MSDESREPETEPLSDDEQAEIRAARKAGYTESAALDLIVKLRETKDRDATISEQAAEIERLRAENRNLKNAIMPPRRTDD